MTNNNHNSIMAHPVRFVIYGDDEPLLSIAVGKDAVSDTHLLSLCRLSQLLTFLSLFCIHHWMQ